MGVREASEILKVSEKTIYRWVTANQIPFFRVGSQYRFSRAKLNEWLVKRSSASSAPLVGSVESEAVFSLGETIKSGGIHYRVGGADIRSVLSEILNFAPLPTSVNQDTLLSVLLDREELSSTGIGDGIAIPHTRDPLLFDLERPLVTLNFLQHPVEFFAIDGMPVKAVFLILCPSSRSHLQVISRLSYALRQGKFINMIHQEASRDAIISRLADLDEQLQAKRSADKS